MKIILNHYVESLKKNQCIVINGKQFSSNIYDPSNKLKDKKIRVNNFLHKNYNSQVFKNINETSTIQPKFRNNKFLSLPYNPKPFEVNHLMNNSLTSLSKHVNLSAKENTGENFIQKNDTHGKDILYQLTPNSNKLVEIVKIKKQIRLWMLFGPCLWNKHIKNQIEELNDQFLRVNYLFDVLNYLKTKNDIMLLKRVTIKYGQYYSLFKTYNFELPSKDDVNLFLNSLVTKKRLADFKRKITESESIGKFRTEIYDYNSKQSLSGVNEKKI